MSETTYYSALHWAKKAEASSTSSANSAAQAQEAVNTLPDYLGQIEAKSNEGLAAINAAVYQRLTVVDSLPSNPVEGVFYFVKE